MESSSGRPERHGGVTSAEARGSTSCTTRERAPGAEPRGSPPPRSAPAAAAAAAATKALGWSASGGPPRGAPRRTSSMVTARSRSRRFCQPFACISRISWTTKLTRLHSAPVLCHRCVRRSTNTRALEGSWASSKSPTTSSNWQAHSTRPPSTGPCPLGSSGSMMSASFSNVRKFRRQRWPMNFMFASLRFRCSSELLHSAPASEHTSASNSRLKVLAGNSG
mmetsp:Transcript_113746/g.361475  ORF Transcript_113746/g.361475 Transcript_113746/m.361475 type:complete len:222 (-) Transcript_113746:693-1358(-)